MSRQLLKIYCLWSLMLLISMTAFAQRTVTGKVTASDDNTTMPGVSIAEKGTSNGTVTDANGSYTITVNDNSTLVFSFVGYENQEVVVGNQSTIDIVLAPDIKLLNEIVVTGYSSQSKRDMTGAISTVAPEVIERTPVQDVGSALKGRVAGVSVDEQGGPGNPAVVRIRGFGTFLNNDPLYVIDGVQMRGSNNLINQNNIETITVLKDPSTTALYGAQGSNGVIVITTKTGKKGVPKLEYNSYIGSEQPIKYPRMLSPQQYADSYWAYQTNSQLPHSDPYYGTGPSPVLPDYIIERQAGSPLIVPEGDPAADIGLYDLKTYRILKTNKAGTDWFREILKPATTQNHQLSLSGANDLSNFAVTFNYTDNKGIVTGTYFKRYSLRANTLFKIKPWLRIGENMEFSYAQSGGVGNHDPNNIMADLYKRTPLIPMYDIAGNFSGPKGLTDGIALHPGGNNPVMGQRNGQKNYGGFNSGIFGTAYVEAEPIKGLVYQTRIGIQLYPYQFHYFYDTYPQNIYSSDYNSFTEGGGYSLDWRWTNKISYDFEINSIHKFSAFVAYEARRFESRDNSATTPNLPFTFPAYQYLSGGVPFTDGTLPNIVGGGGDIVANNSVFGNINYSLKDKYLFSVVVRRDGSSKFATLRKYGTFPSISAGWRISAEPFMEAVSWVNELKLRVAVGVVGNDAIASGMMQNQYSTDTYTSSYDLGGNNSSASTGVGLYQVGNTLLQWEENHTTNVGFDAAFLKNRLTASVNVFDRTTDKLLYAPPITGLQGDAIPPFQNVMKFSNKGFELELGYNSPTGGDFHYEMNFNISTYRNKVLYISNDPKAFILGSNYFPTHFSMNRSEVGRPVASFYGYQVEGIFQEVQEIEDHATQVGIDKAEPTRGLGHFKFKDINNDGVINSDDQTWIGSPHPKFTFGYNVNLYYKNFDLGIFLEGTYGNKIFNYWRAFTKWPGRMAFGADNTWDPGNRGAELPIWHVGYGATDDVPSSFFIEDGSYMRIRNIQLGYVLPKMKAFTKFRVYVQAFNVATFTNYSGIDPQISTGSPGSAGVDFGGNYPISRKILFGVNIGL